MRFAVVGWVNGHSTLIIVRIIEIFTRIDRPSVLLIILEIGLFRIVVMLISVPTEVGVVIISSIRGHVISSLRVMYWEVVLAVLEELRDRNVIIIFILKEFCHSDIISRQELANGAIEEFGD